MRDVTDEEEEKQPGNDDFWNGKSLYDTAHEHPYTLPYADRNLSGANPRKLRKTVP